MILFVRIRKSVYVLALKKMILKHVFEALNIFYT